MVKLRRLFALDHTVFGLILGLLCPWLGFLIFYGVKFLPHRVSFSGFADQIFGNRLLLAPVLSLCLIVNALVFFLYIRFRKDLTAKGLLVATILYGCVIVVLKFL
ncbi:MAG TPA: hypothetical protein VMV20_01410 [Chitinophagaceae bacterium]|nr:hypothetical protein [Chitinophagaceae bacterium]